jgi:hypothetical protein
MRARNTNVIVGRCSESHQTRRNGPMVYVHDKCRVPRTKLQGFGVYDRHPTKVHQLAAKDHCHHSSISDFIVYLDGSLIELIVWIKPV